MGKKTFQEYLCRPYCMFFKDGEKEEMACRAAGVLDTLVQRKYVDLTTIPSPIKNHDLWKKYRNVLDIPLCSHCPFRAEDCDFQAEVPSDDLEPCGGFILLVHLLANDLIQKSDLE